MAGQGWCEPIVRLPLVEMNEREKAATDAWVKELLKEKNSTKIMFTI
jgi:4-hydroxy-tetrahydrodipicolinate synthase